MFYDCHAHILNIDFVPDEFIGLNIPLSKKIMTAASKVFHVLWPFSSSDCLDDVAAFEKSMGQSQEQNFLDLKALLPENACICVVTMDFYSVKGKPKIPFEVQIGETLALREKMGRDAMKVFIGIDPNTIYMDELISDHLIHCDGVKIYPPLASIPTHPYFEKLWNICQARQLPITAHCGDSGVSAPTFFNSKAKDYANPKHWRLVLEKFPRLKVNLAHFGSGNADWERQILDLMLRYPNVYTDTAYSIGSDARMKRYKQALETDPIFKERLLFGTDYHILNMETQDLKKSVARAKAFLGDEAFRLASEINPKAFLARL